MDKSEMTEKLFELEKQVQLLKDELAPTKVVPSRWQRFSKRMGGFSKWLGSHWFLITFIGALLTAGWVKYRYGVAYFEDPKNIATTKKLAEFYRKLGDDMLSDFEYEAAASAYDSSLALEKNNEKAAQGLVKARIYLPLPGHKSAPPAEVVDYKLRHLMEQFPDDPQLLIMKSFQEYARENTKGAIELAERAIEIKPDFSPAHTQLGFYKQIGFTDEAIKHYEKALELDCDSSIAQNNLGSCRMLLTDFPKAIELLEKSNARIDRLETTILLGDSYRYNKQFAEALKTHDEARSILEASKDNQSELVESRYISGLSVLNYMPQRKGDTKTFKEGIEISRPEDFTALLYYSLSFDYAMTNDLKQAEKAYREAAKVEAEEAMKKYVRSHLVYMLNEMEMGAATRDWLSRKARGLEAASPESKVARST